MFPPVFARKRKHLFRSQRLGFRKWNTTDEDILYAINSDRAVMRYFPSTISLEKTRDFIQRMNEKWQEKGYCYWAVERLDQNEVIGFIGLSDLAFEAPFAPSTDIGWRLGRKHWNHGFATEGAIRCLEYAKQELGINRITAVAPKINRPSIMVMEKIGMDYKQDFRHPQLGHTPELEICALYEKKYDPTR
jgi:RimJ/RimL family protein N-acetyltransferase